MLGGGGGELSLHTTHSASSSNIRKSFIIHLHMHTDGEGIQEM